MTYRLDFASFPNHPVVRRDVHDSAVQGTARLLDEAHDDEHARLARDALELLAGPVAPLLRRDLRVGVPDGRRHLNGMFATIVDAGQLPLDPGVAGARAAGPHGIAQVDGGLEVAQELVAALGGARAHPAAKVRAAGVTAEVGLGQQEQVGLGGGGARGELLELGQGFLGGGLGRRRCRG